MGLETGSYITDLDPTNPDGATDYRSTLDDHIQLVKTCVKQTFPNMNAAVSALPADLNLITGAAAAGVTASDVQAIDGFSGVLSVSVNELTLATGKTLNITDDSGLKIAGTPISATASELNKLDGVTAVTADLELLAGLAASGVTAADLQAVDGFNGVISSDGTEMTLATTKTINIADTSALKIGGVPVTRTAAQLNYVDVSSGIQGLLDAKQADLDVPDNTEIDAGTATTERVWTAAGVKRAAQQHGTPAAGSVTAAMLVPGQFGGEVAILRHEEASGVPAGASYTTYTKRTLNVENDPSGIVTLASSVFTLQAGTYHITSVATCRGDSGQRTRLYNASDSTVVELGTTVYNYYTNWITNSTSHIDTIVTIASAKDFELQDKAKTARASEGWGTAASLGDNEVYASITIRKIK